MTKALNVPVELLMAYCDKVATDYKNWTLRCNKNDAAATAVALERADFNVTYEIGSKYIKIITGSWGGSHSVHSFILNQVPTGKAATKGFVVGDILKAASWAAPALNFPRGNIFELNKINVRWTEAM